MPSLWDSIYHWEPVSDNIVNGRRSKTVWKIVEKDRFGENPFIYFIHGAKFKKCALIDTGCGTGDLRQFLYDTFKEQLTDAELIIINTHGHFDHVGGNRYFCEETPGRLVSRCKDICAGGAAPQVTKDPEQNLGSFVGCDVGRYMITRWLDDGDCLVLGDDIDSRLYVIHAPGHTADSICLYYPGDRRLFVGDFIYRWAHILAMSPSSSIVDYERSCATLLQFISALPEKDEIRLSCGHIDENLEWEPYLSQFRGFLNDIIQGRNEGVEAPAGYQGRIHHTKDGTFSFMHGRIIGGTTKAGT